MKARINKDGKLVLTPESDIEYYVIKENFNYYGVILIEDVESPIIVPETPSIPGPPVFIDPNPNSDRTESKE